MNLQFTAFDSHFSRFFTDEFCPNLHRQIRCRNYITEVNFKDVILSDIYALLHGII